MNDFLIWLSNNPIATSIVSVALGLVVFVVAVLYVVAFFQGRDISFWPPKIGQKTFTFTNSSQIKLEDRSEYDVTFEKRLSQVKNVAMCGTSLVGILSHYRGFIQSKAETGCKFRFLIMHPEVYPNSGKHATEVKEEIYTSIKILETLIKNENIKYKVVKFRVQFSLMIINSGMPESTLQVEIHPYQSIASERPHFWLSKKDHSKWYSFFSEQFETAWQNATEYRASMKL